MREKDIKEENLRLSRELADACREIVETRFAYQVLSKRLECTEGAFIQFLLKNKIVFNAKDAKTCVNAYVEEIMNPPKQLSFDFLKIEDTVNV